jgi:hypothetical protein
MSDFLRPPYNSIWFSAILFVALIATAFIAHRVAKARGRDSEKAAQSFGMVTASVFALLGLLIAFTFSGAYSRYETRRNLIIEEANAISTAYMRLDLLPAAAQTSLRAEFKRYVQNREAFIQALAGKEAVSDHLLAGQALQNRIWSETVQATAAPEYQHTRVAVLPALNEMIDITTKRTAAAMAHPPMIVFMMLATVALACSWLTGYGAGRQASVGQVYVFFFAAVTAFMLYVILDIEYPSSGMINLKRTNEFLIELHRQM